MDRSLVRCTWTWSLPGSRGSRPRFAWRPYILRAYFDTQLLIAESKGRIAHDFRVFFMGHKGSMEARYTTNKGVLPEMLAAEMRESFARSEEFLDLEDGAAAHADLQTAQDHKQEMHDMIQNATPEQVGLMLEALRRAGNMQGQTAATAAAQTMPADRLLLMQTPQSA